MSSVDYDDAEPFVFTDPPRRPDAVTILSRIMKSLLAIAAVTALILAGVAIHRLNGVVEEARTAGGVTRTKAAHTRALQKQSEPASACLREAMKAGLPVIVNFADVLEKHETQAPPADRAVFGLFVTLTRRVEVPLSEYVALTKARYAGVSCPDASRASHTSRVLRNQRTR